MKVVLSVICGLCLIQCISAFNYDLKSQDKTCLFARFVASLSIPYTTVNGTQAIANIPLNENLTPGGNCAGNGSTAELSLTGGPDVLTMTFKQENNSNVLDTVLDTISYSFVYEEAHFPDAGKAEKGKNATVSASVAWTLAPAGEYYMCNAANLAQLDGGTAKVNLTMTDATFQVFDIVDNKMSTNKTECASDVTTPATTHTTHTTPNGTNHTTHTTPGNHTHHTNHTTHVTTPANHTTGTTVMTTTAMPNTPSTGSWNFSINGTTCVLVDMGVRMTVEYMDEKKKSMSSVVDLPMDAMVDPDMSVCNKSTDVLVLRFFDNKWMLTVQMDEDKSKAYISMIQLDYVLDKERFPDAPKELAEQANATGLELFKASKDNYYQCNAKKEQKLGSTVTLDFYDMKLQGFRDDKDSDFKGTAEECSDDEKTSALVPIVVGAALAALVVIVLIAYLIGRRRRQSGYQSV